MTKSRAAVTYHAAVASLPCVLCELLGQTQTTRTEVHHCRDGQGMSQRASHFLVAALCEECHRGRLGLHGSRALMKIVKVQELDLVARTTEAAWRAANG